MLQDFTARGMAAQTRNRARRLATLDALARGIAENLPLGLPAVMQTPIPESRASSTQIASGTSYLFSTTASANLINHFSLYSGLPEAYNSTNVRMLSHHGGNGSDPSAVSSYQTGTVRFATFADKFEIVAHNHLGFRVKVNGKYTKTGMYGVSALNGDSAGSARFFLFDFAGTEFAGDGLKLVELQGYLDFRFGGARVPMGYTVQPWPQALPIKAALHGDSMVSTVSDTGTDYRTALHGIMPNIASALTGIADIWANNIGGAGFMADSGGTRSNFIEQAAVDFAGEKFDLVWELGGRNDTPFYGSQAVYQAVVERWIEILLADNPDTIIVLTGPLTMTNAESYPSSAASAAVQNAKKAAAATYPRNCAFIETAGGATVTATSNPWVFGTGKQGATTSDGNADLVRGSDGTHPTVFGHRYLGSRLVAETARVIPLLFSRIRDGVIAGVNDLDLAA